MSKRLRQFQVDAFTDTLFHGNPAAVVILEDWPDDHTLQAIAVENAYSETAYLLPADASDADFHLRWFTPGYEVDLCGHATLASAHALYSHLDFERSSVRFSTRSGVLTVRRAGDRYAMDFPAHASEPCDDPVVADALGITPAQVRQSLLPHAQRLAVLESEAQVRDARPDLDLVRTLPGGCLLITGPGDTVDFVSRFFAPTAGIDEDPVTGSAHCLLTPYWSRRLGKAHLEAHQLSRRGGALTCEDRGDRIIILGRAVTFLEGWICV